MRLPPTNSKTERMSANNNSTDPDYKPIYFTKVDYGMDYAGDATPQPQDAFVSRMMEMTATMMAAKRGTAKPPGRPVVHTMPDGSRVFLPPDDDPNCPLPPATRLGPPQYSKKAPPSHLAMDYELPSDPVESKKFVEELEAATGLKVESIGVDEPTVPFAFCRLPSVSALP